MFSSYYIEKRRGGLEGRDVQKLEELQSLILTGSSIDYATSIVVSGGLNMNRSWCPGNTTPIYKSVWGLTNVRMERDNITQLRPTNNSTQR